MNDPGRKLGVHVGSREMLLGMLVQLFHCLYCFRGCAEGSGMRLIHPPEGKRRRRKRGMKQSYIGRLRAMGVYWELCCSRYSLDNSFIVRTASALVCGFGNALRLRACGSGFRNGFVFKYVLRFRAYGSGFGQGFFFGDSH